MQASPAVTSRLSGAPGFLEHHLVERQKLSEIPRITITFSKYLPSGTHLQFQLPSLFQDKAKFYSKQVPLNLFPLFLFYLLWIIILGCIYFL